MSGRYSHYWYTATGRRYPNRIAVLDCDSAASTTIQAGGGQTEQLTRWCLSVAGVRRGVRHSLSSHTGEDADSLAALLSQLLVSRQRTWLFMPNCGRILPLIRFWEALERGVYQLYGRDWRESLEGLSGEELRTPGLCVVEDPPTLILAKMPGRPGKLTILDVRNWGLELYGHDQPCRERAEQYTDALCECLSTLWHHWPVSLRATAAAQAVSALRTLEACRQLHCHTHADTLALERAAIFGGRCEAYRLGQLPGEVYHVDYRSMYPGICLDLAVPVSLRRYYSDPGAIERSAGRCPETHIADVEISTANPVFPLRRGGYTIYAVGRYRTTLAGPELAAAVASDAITRWHAGAEYTCRPVLRAYYRRWLEMLSAARASGAVPVAQWIKRVMNGLIGKLAEPGKSWVPCPPLTERGPYGRWTMDGPDGTPQRWRNIAWHTQREVIDGESNWSVPAVNAFVTSAGRCRLHADIQTAGRGNVWYCDTDSLLVNRDGFDKLLRHGDIREGETGHLRLIGRHQRGIVYGIRHYQLDEVVTCAGVPVGEIAPGETRAAYWQRAKIRDEIAVGRRPAGRDIAVPLPTALDYHHGQVMGDGSVIPWQVEE